MEASGLLAYVATLVAVTAVPGPLIALLIARSLESDRTGAVTFAAGWCAGKIVAVALVFAGLASWAHGHPELMATGRYLGAAYLLWLAARMWHPPSISDPPPAAIRSALGSGTAGLLLSVSSPYTLMLYVVLLPGLVRADALDATRFAIVAVVTGLVLAVVLGGVILLAAQARQLFAFRNRSVVGSRCMAATVAASTVWVLVA